MFGRGLGDTYVVFLLPLEREFGWSRSQLTSVYSIYLLVHGFTSPLVGLLFDRLGPRWVYATGMACLGAAFLLAGELVSLWQFYLFIGALVGLGVSLNGMVPGSALLARWYRERLSSAIASRSPRSGSARSCSCRSRTTWWRTTAGGSHIAFWDRRSRARPHRRLRSAVEAVLRGRHHARGCKAPRRAGRCARRCARRFTGVFARCSSAPLPRCSR